MARLGRVHPEVGSEGPAGDIRGGCSGPLGLTFQASSKLIREAYRGAFHTYIVAYDLAL
jgi:hypothetical protein